MKSLAERVATATAAGYVAEARHRGVRREDICLTMDTPGFTDRELMTKLCAKLRAEQEAQFAKWENEAEKLVTQYEPEIRAVADELRTKLHLTGMELKSVLKDSLNSCMSS
jgi:hypothetical protein